MFDDASQGVDRYNHNGSLWAIFTNKMRWVVEFTKDQTLWYNYDFFEDEMKLIGLNSVENKDLIKKWFESRFLGIPKVEDSCEPFFNQDQYVKETIQSGVKQTELSKRDFFPKDILQNGVNHTFSSFNNSSKSVEDAIQNGVKHTTPDESTIVYAVEDVIQNGVKEILRGYSQIRSGVKDTLQNGVKHTEDGDWLDGDERFNNIIQNGVKNLGAVDYDNLKGVEDIIQNGVKETYDDCSNNIARVEGIIRIGEKIS